MVLGCWLGGWWFGFGGCFVVFVVDGVGIIRGLGAIGWGLGAIGWVCGFGWVLVVWVGFGFPD